MLKETFISLKHKDRLKDFHRSIIMKTRSNKPVIYTNQKKIIITNPKDRSREKINKTIYRLKYALKPQQSKS